MSTQQFFSDNNMRSWIVQIQRLFSNFTVQYGLDSNGAQMYSKIPVIWGDSTFNASTIQRLNSENIMPSVPLMSIYITDLKPNASRRQNPTYVESKQVRTRQWDEATGKYLAGQANAYTISRIMPVPYDLSFKVDIVTSSTNQKCQILEQLLPLFNPALEIQKNDNYLDWESLSIVEQKDIQWSNRSIPTGTSGNDSLYDVFTMTFQTPIWMSLPAKVSKMGVIFKVINNLSGYDGLSDLVYGTRQVVTFNNYGLYVENNTIRILNQFVQAPFANVSNTSNLSPQNAITNYALYGQPLEWSGILAAYGNIRPGLSKIGLTYDNSDSEISGTITISNSDPTIVNYSIDTSTLPSNSISSINGVVNPYDTFFTNPNVGDSYIITSNIGSDWPYSPAIPVANTANQNDIVTYNGNAWITTFASANNSGNVNFVWDNASNVQYQWNGNAWVDGWYGPYPNYKWRLII
jgi:hypothetical protein